MANPGAPTDSNYQFRIGSGNNSTADVYFWHPVISNDTADYPIGPHEVRGYSPDSIGTHNLDAATSAFFFKDDGAGTETALTTSETTSYQNIDDVPLDADSAHVLVKATSGGGGPGASLPVYQNTVSHTGNPTTAPSATLGTTAANDILICVITSGGSNTTPTPGGTYNGGAWTLVDNGQLTTTGNVAVYWSRCTGNHSGQTVNSTTVDSGSIQVHRFNNVYSGGNPIGANKIESITTNAANPGLSAFTTTTANSKVILAVGADDNLASMTAATVGGNAMSVVTAATSSGGADSGVGFAHRDQATAGTTGAFTTTWGANAAGTGKYLLAFELLGAEASATQPTNTWYVEYGIADSAESSAPLSVMGIVGLKQDSAANCSIAARIRAAGADKNIYNGDINSATTIYKSNYAPNDPSGSPWTDTTFDAATLRWGFTNDADGTPRLESAMFEALFDLSVAPPSADDVVPYVGGGYY